MEYIPLILQHPDKFEGSSTCLRVPGIDLDSLALQACLQKDKFEWIAALLESGLGNTIAPRRSWNL